MVWPTDIVDRAIVATNSGSAVPIGNMEDLVSTDAAAGDTVPVTKSEEYTSEDEKLESQISEVESAEEEKEEDEKEDEEEEEEDEETLEDTAETESDTMAEDVIDEDATETESETTDEKYDPEPEDDEDLMVFEDICPSESTESVYAEAPGESSLVAVLSTDKVEAQPEPEVVEEEAAFIGATQNVKMKETQEAQITEEPSLTTKELQVTKQVVVDDAVPVSDVKAPKSQAAAEKSVCSASGTETDDSLNVDDGGHTTVTKAHIETPRSGSRRRLRICIFSFVVIGMILGAIVALLFGMGLISGRANNSLRATAAPTSSPTASPTASPTSAPVVITEAGVTNAPTASPTAYPTAAPTPDPLWNLLRFFSGTSLDDTTSPQYQAFQWMRSEDPFVSSADVETDIDALRIYQRYALISMHASMAGKIPSFASDDECTWPTVSCGTANNQSLAKAEDWQVSELKMARMSLRGSIPPEISLLSPSIVHLDLAENQLAGSLPDELYMLTRLKNLYLHNNAFTGTISEGIANLQLLEDLYLGNNKLNGTIPVNLGSLTQGTRPLRKLTFVKHCFARREGDLTRSLVLHFTGKLILHHNELEGPIPENLNLPDAIYIDFSFNQLNGTLPQDLGEDSNSLRSLYLDHNNITGAIPESYTTTGLISLVSLYLNDNVLTGTLPATWVSSNDKDASSPIDTINVENNLLTKGIEKDICELSVFNHGQLVELRADCDICWCDSLCEYCWE